MYRMYRKKSNDSGFLRTYSVLYGLLPIDLFPKLTEEDKGYKYLSLLVDSWRSSSECWLRPNTKFIWCREGVQSCLHNNTMIIVLLPILGTCVDHRRLLWRGGALVHMEWLIYSLQDSTYRFRAFHHSRA